MIKRIFISLNQKMSQLANTIGSLSDVQSLELAQAIRAIDASGNLSAFTQQQRQDIINTIVQEHSDTASKNFSDDQRSTDNLNNMLYYYSRSKDVNELQNNVLDTTTQQAQAAVHDGQLAKRQFEINEWSAANKGETVFIMQLLLMAVTFTIFMLFLNRMGALPTPIFIFVTTIIFIAFILTFVIRYQYTAYSRDTRYWNRKRQTPMVDNVLPDSCLTSLIQAEIAGGASNLSSIGDNIANAYYNIFEGFAVNKAYAANSGNVSY
jgi:uncharacterized membrane protein